MIPDCRPLLKPETGGPEDGECDTNGTGLYWTTWFNLDTPAGEGDWEMLSAIDGSDVCANPRAIQAGLLFHLRKCS